MPSEAIVTITKRGSGYKTTDTGLYVKAAVVGGTNITFDVSDLHIAENCDQTGDDYLVLTDSATGDPTGYLYSGTEDVWSSKFLDAGESSDYLPSFYSVDGALRVSDANFGSKNENQWYGYIDRRLFKESAKTYETDRWINESQFLTKPDVGNYTTTVISSGPNTNNYLAQAVSGNDTRSTFRTNTQLNTALGLDVVIRVKIEIQFKTPSRSAGSGDSPEPSASFTGYLRTGVGTGSNHVGQNNSVRYISSELNGWGRTITVEYEIDFDMSGANGIDIAANSSTTGVLTELQSVSIRGNSTSGCTAGIKKVTYYDGTLSGTASADLTYQNVICEIEEADNTNAELWDNNGWNWGVTFVYDDAQESRVRQLTNKTDTTGFSNYAANKSPKIKVIWKYSDDWNRRITGINLYTRKSGKKITDKSWYRQVEVDFISSVAKMTHGGKEFDIVYVAGLDEYYAEIGQDYTSSPNLIDSFEIRNGYLEDVESTQSKFKTAVVANRKTYIANLEVKKSDGSRERMADAMLKSPPNQFDVFPFSNIIEASVRDGDVIVKLEEYADRILQFKKDKMHIINVSQNIEFMEGTFNFKGIKHPAAACKTDYGIAWVNPNGCFLYNGREVVNLLERGAIRIIKESEWQSFITDDSIVGYLPKKRQLIILKTCSASGVGDVFIFDMITKGWVKGDSKFADNSVKTNFINDWNGDLVLAHGAGGNVVKWDDDSYASTSFSYVTPDIDFGQPAQRKRIYKVYVTYKSGSTNVPTFTYGIDGDTSVATVAASGVFETSESDWAKAEFKLGSDANNCYSIRFKINGSVDAQFEINDMSVVFRGKPVK